MNRDKKQLEILLINYFRKSFADFPKGKIRASESPDFVVLLKNRHQLGIELTRLNPESRNTPDEQLIRQNESRENFITLVQSLVEKDIPHHLFVKFHFSETNSIQAEKEMMVAVQTAKTIRNQVFTKKANSFFSIHIPASDLTSGLEEILVVNHPKMKNSIWERSNNLGISNDVLDDIRVSILKKDEKLRLYQKQRLNYYWLLILTDRLRGVKSMNLQNQIYNHTFESQFQRVYLFDLIKAKVFELVN